MAAIPAEKNNILVSVTGLDKTYFTRRGEVPALRDVSVEIESGEILVLLGPSGCGKTTLLRCIAGLEYPDAGEIVVHGRTVFSAGQNVTVPPEKRNISMVFQSYALWPHMTVFQNVAYPLKISKVPDEEIKEVVHRTLTLTGLEPLSTNYPGQLSGGQQQRVALARALVANTGVIMFDEPLSNLDAKVREKLRDEIISMQAEFGFTGIYVTHDQVEAAALASRIAVMEVGKIGQLGTPHDVFNFPQSQYVADFVGCTNRLEGTMLERTGRYAKVSTPIGNLIGVSPTELAPGEPACVMFRPEHCYIAGSGAASENLLRAKVGHYTFLGSHIEYRLNTVDNELLLRSMQSEPLDIGAEVSFTVNPDLIRVFPKADPGVGR